MRTALLPGLLLVAASCQFHEGGPGGAREDSGPAAPDGSVDGGVAPDGGAGGPRLLISSFDVPAEVVRGQRGVQVIARVTTTDAEEDAAVTGARLAFRAGQVDLGSNYQVVTDYRNPRVVAAGETVDLHFWIGVDPAPGIGIIEIEAMVEGFFPGAGVLSRDEETASWEVLDETGPRATINAPVPPETRLCAGEAVDFDGSGSAGAATFAWTLAGGSPSSSADPAPAGVTYAEVGSYPYQLTVTDPGGRMDTAFSTDLIFVGEVMPSSQDRYVTGPIVFEPLTEVDLDDLPSDKYLDSDDDAVHQCDGDDVRNNDAENSESYLTLYVDRGRLDPDDDERPDLPGVQVDLHRGNHFDNANLLPDSPSLEGPAIFYAEYRIPGGPVTAASFVEFEMVNDTEEPDYLALRPAEDCESACFGPEDRFLFVFSEPMDPASFSGEVSVRTSSSCESGDGFNVTGSASIDYLPGARTLAIGPPPDGWSNSAVTVTLSSSITDSSSNKNPLPATRSLCARIDPALSQEAPQPPDVSASPPSFAPNGDGNDEEVVFEVTAPAGAAAIRVEVTSGGRTLATILRPLPLTEPLTWNGRDHTGRLVPDAYYVYRVTAENGGGERSDEVLGLVEVDTGIGLVGVPRRF